MLATRMRHVRETSILIPAIAAVESELFDDDSVEVVKLGDEVGIALIDVEPGSPAVDVVKEPSSYTVNGTAMYEVSGTAS
jgi:hypothetical protein